MDMSVVPTKVLYILVNNKKFQSWSLINTYMDGGIFNYNKQFKILLDYIIGILEFFVKEITKVIIPI